MVRMGYWQYCLVPVCLVLVACGSNPPHPANPATSSASYKTVASRDKAVGQPALKLGQQWTFRRVDLWRNEIQERFEQELRMREGDQWTVQWRIVFSDNPQRRGSITGEYLDAKSQSFFDPKMEFRHLPLSFPLQVGKTWSFNYRIHSQPGRLITINQNAIVEGWEFVTVPAGSFRALKVVHRGRYSAKEGFYDWSGRIEETYWYAPEAMRVVKMEYRDTKGDGTVYDQWRDEMTSMRL